MYTGGARPGTPIPGRATGGPLPTNQPIPTGPPAEEPPPVPQATRSAASKKSLRHSMVSLSGIKKKSAPSSSSTLASPQGTVPKPAMPAKPLPKATMPPKPVVAHTPPPKPFVKRHTTSDTSLLAAAQKIADEEKKTAEDGPPPKLVHTTASRPMRGGGAGGRRPPSRKPMGERESVKAEVAPVAAVSLVAEKKPPPEDLDLASNIMKPVRPQAPKSMSMSVSSATMEKKLENEAILAIEREKKKTAVQTVGTKTVMRIFLDNAGLGSKMVPVMLPCNMYSLVEIMRKKVFTDTTGFGIYEVRDKTDVRLIDPTEDVTEVMNSWKQDVQFKFVFKKALGSHASLYLNPPPSPSSSSSSHADDNKPAPLTASLSDRPSMPEKPGMPAKPLKPTLSNPPEKPPSLPEKPALPEKPTMPSKPATMPEKPSVVVPAPVAVATPEKPAATMPEKPSKPAYVPPQPDKEKPAAAVVSATPDKPAPTSTQPPSTSAPSPVAAMPEKPSKPTMPSSGPPKSTPPLKPDMVSSDTTTNTSNGVSAPAAGGESGAQSAPPRPAPRTGVSRREPPKRPQEDPSTYVDSPVPSPVLAARSNFNNRPTSMIQRRPAPAAPASSPPAASPPPTPVTAPVSVTPSSLAAPPVSSSEKLAEEAKSSPGTSRRAPPTRGNINTPGALPTRGQSFRGPRPGAPLRAAGDASNTPPPGPSSLTPSKLSPLVRASDSPKPALPTYSQTTTPPPSEPTKAPEPTKPAVDAPPSKPSPATPLAKPGFGSPSGGSQLPSKSPAAEPPKTPIPAIPTPAPTPAVTTPAPAAAAPAPAPAAAPASAAGFKSKPVQEWSVEEVGDWIAELGFEKMRSCFVENYISGMELIDLANDELKDDLGVTALGARKAILREIAILKEAH